MRVSNLFYYTCVCTIQAAKIKTFIKKSYLPWLENYTVVKRDIAETKLQVLYSSLLNNLNSDLLNTLILKESF